MSTILSTQATKVFIKNTQVSPNTAVEIDLLNGFNGLGGDAKKIDVTTFSSSTTMEYRKGLIDPKQASGELIFAADSPAHQLLLQLQALAGTNANTQLCVCWSDGTGSPTIVAGDMTPPTTGSPAEYARSGILTDCFVMTVSFKAPVNEVVRADLTIQPTGEPLNFVKGDTP